MEGSSSKSNASASSSRKEGKKQKLSLETYIDFLSSPKQFPLTMQSLNQIISIHGFKKLLHVSRGEVREAVETLDLIDPSRSTLTSSISPCAALTAEEIIRDLNLLHWQDCCVASVQSINSSPEQQSHSVTKERDNRKRNTQVADISEPLDSSSQLRSKLISKRKMKKRRMTDV